VNVKQHEVLEDFVHKDSFLSAQGLLGKVFAWIVFMEVAGAFCLFLTWDEAVSFRSTGDKIFSSVFHSVSAFNNAGISLVSDGFYNEQLRENYMVHWVITILVFFGALGVMAIFDLFDPVNLRDRLRNPWKRLNFQTKIALYFSLVLVILGSVLYFVLEYNNTLDGLSTFGAITTSVFQSVTRTSGFNSADIGAIGIPMLFILTILMFIGSSSSSTGGGIKTSTLAIIYADVLSTIRGRNYTELFKRTISPILKSRAYSVLLFFIIGNLLCIFLLSITEQHILAMEGRSIMDLIFEEVSALGTVGLSMGITADLSVYGKLIIIASMFVGRVGTLTVAFALSGKLISKNYKYPEGHTMVG
jgi:Trk-type K+ transport system membrane component